MHIWQFIAMTLTKAYKYFKNYRLNDKENFVFLQKHLIFIEKN